MERATGIGGVFVRSPHPDALRAWYAERLGLELQEFGGAVLRLSGGETLTWAVFPGDTDYFGSRGQQAMGRRARVRSLRLGHGSRREPLRALGARRGW